MDVEQNTRKNKRQLIAEIEALHAEVKRLKLDASYQPQGEELLRQQVERERLLAIVTQKVRQSLAIDETLATAVTEVRQTLQADRALIFQLRPDGAGVVVKESVVPEYPVTNEMLFVDECFPSECYEHYRQGLPRVVLDVATDKWADCLSEFMQSVGVKSKIVAPIIHRNKVVPRVWGLLIVHSCAAYRHWQSVDAEFLQQVSNQLAIAIHQSELYEQLQAELSERQRIEAALQQSEALFRSLSESSPIGIFRSDKQNQCIYTNPCCQAIFGFTAEEALGKGWQKFVHPDDLAAYLTQRDAAIAAQQELVTEIRSINPDGIRYCKLRIAPIFSADGEPTGHVGMVEDITESREIERVKNEFISIVSHELRTPLASIRGALGLLASDVLKDDLEATERMLKVAEVEAERLVRLVNDMLDLERLTSNKVLLDKQLCDAGTLIQQSVEALQPLAEENQIALSYTQVSTPVWADPDRIIQTLVNIISNAIKFSPPGETVTVIVEPQSDRVLFKVQDRGRGIPADKLESIFGRFQQVDTSDARQKGGTGLGLSICRNIVQQHNGQIWVESVLGAGSTFCFTLPLLQEEV